MVRDLTRGKPIKLILEMSVPLILSGILQQLYNTVDALIVGKFVGEAGLAAVGMSFSVFFLVNSVIIGATLGVSIIVSQYFGAKEVEELKETISTAIMSLMVLAVGVSIFGIALTKTILRIMQTPSEVMVEAVPYLQIIFGGTVFTLLYNIYSGVLRAVGDTRTPLLFLVITSILNIFLDLIFVAKLNMGTAGAAYATVIAQGISSIFCVLYIKARIPMLYLKKDEYVFKKEKFDLIVKYGGPAALQQSVIAIGNMATQSIVNTYGTYTMAGYAAAIRIDSFLIMPYINIGMALSNFIGQNVGAGLYDRAKSGLKSAYAIIITISILFLPIIRIFGSDLIKGFLESGNEISISTGKMMLEDLSFLYIFLGFLNNTQGLLRGSGDNVFSLYGSMISIGVRIIAAYILNEFIGVRCVWIGEGIGWILGYCFVLARFFQGGWKNKSVMKYKQK